MCCDVLMTLCWWLMCWWCLNECTDDWCVLMCWCVMTSSHSLAPEARLTLGPGFVSEETIQRGIHKKSDGFWPRRKLSVQHPKMPQNAKSMAIKIPPQTYIFHFPRGALKDPTELHRSLYQTNASSRCYNSQVLFLSARKGTELICFTQPKSDWIQNSEIDESNFVLNKINEKSNFHFWLQSRFFQGFRKISPNARELLLKAVFSDGNLQWSHEKVRGLRVCLRYAAGAA
jgi:hypothetical protein